MTSAEVIARAMRPNCLMPDGFCGDGCACELDVAAILAALRGAGFAVVPREPSKYMVDEGSLHTGGLLGKAALTYRAMIAAAEPCE